MLPCLEQRMQQIIGENLKITHREMVPENAAKFFRSLPRYYPSLFAKTDPRPLVDLFEMGGFVDLCPAPYARSSGEIGFVKLIKAADRPPITYRKAKRQVTRITGVIGKDKPTLKLLLKEKNLLLDAEHQRYGTKNGYFFIHVERGKDLREMHRCFWLDKGEKLRDMLTTFWKNAHKNEGYQLIHTQGNDLLKNHLAFFQLVQKKCGEKTHKFAECSRIISEKGVDQWQGLFVSQDDQFDRAHIFCSEKNVYSELIAALNFIQNTLALFHFETEMEIFISDTHREIKMLLQITCRGKRMRIKETSNHPTRIVWKVTDRFGNKRCGPFLELRKGKGVWIIIHSLFYRWGWLIALMMEGWGVNFEKLIKGIAKKQNLNKM